MPVGHANTALLAAHSVAEWGSEACAVCESLAREPMPPRCISLHPQLSGALPADLSGDSSTRRFPSRRATEVKFKNCNWPEWQRWVYLNGRCWLWWKVKSADVLSQKKKKKCWLHCIQGESQQHTDSTHTCSLFSSAAVDFHPVCIMISWFVLVRRHELSL